MNNGLENIKVNNIYAYGKYFASTDGHGVYYWSKNAGIWEPFNMGIENDTVIGVFWGGVSSSEVSNLWAATKNGMFYHNANLTDTLPWISSNIGLENIRMTAISGVDDVIYNIIEDGFPLIEPYSIFVSTEDGGFYYQKRVKDSTFWVMDTSGLNGAIINNLKIRSGSYLYSSTNKGIYVTRSSQIYTDYKEQQNSNTFLINPNPVIGNANIIFEIKNDSHVTISVTNTIGNKIILINNQYYEKGIHSIQVNTSELSSGLYFCTIESGESTNSKKIVVFK